MTTEQHERCMRQLARAKRGDEHARKALVDFVAEDYSGMIQNFYTSDPVLGVEDIRSEFYWAIWRAVDDDKGLGDSIFYLAQRGEWAVKSLITAINKRRHGTSAPEGGVSVVSLNDNGREDEFSWEPADTSVLADQQAVVEIREGRTEARHRVLDILVRADLKPRHEEILQILLNDELDLGERLSRKELAKILGVSGQRITQLIQSLECKMTEAEAMTA